MQAYQQLSLNQSDVVLSSLPLHRAYVYPNQPQLFSRFTTPAVTYIQHSLLHFPIPNPRGPYDGPSGYASASDTYNVAWATGVVCVVVLSILQSRWPVSQHVAPIPVSRNITIGSLLTCTATCICAFGHTHCAASAHTCTYPTFNTVHSKYDASVVGQCE